MQCFLFSSYLHIWLEGLPCTYLAHELESVNIIMITIAAVTVMLYDYLVL